MQAARVIDVNSDGADLEDAVSVVEGLKQFRESGGEGL
jgi:hypothetical protein